MKRCIMMAVAAVLILSSLFCLPENVNPMIVAGMGDGVNSEVNDAGDLKELIRFFGEKDIAGSVSSGKGYDYTGLTLVEQTHLVSNNMKQKVVEYSYDGEPVYENVGKTVTKMNRNLTVYVTEKESYYVIKGYFSVKYDDYKDDENDSESKVAFDIQLYVNRSKNLIKFNLFDVKSSSKSVKINLNGYTGKWLDVSKDFVNDIFDFVSGTDMGTLSMAQSLINGDMSDFDKVDNKYTHKTTTMSKDDTVLTIDLNDPENPFIGLKVKGNDSDVYRSNTMRMTDYLTFSNIDNTVIDVDLASVYELSDEEIAEIFGGDQ